MANPHFFDDMGAKVKSEFRRFSGETRQRSRRHQRFSSERSYSGKYRMRSRNRASGRTDLWTPSFHELVNAVCRDSECVNSGCT